jgi:hypothetical protein
MLDSNSKMQGQTLRVPTRDTRPFEYGLQPKKPCKSKTLNVGREEHRSVLNPFEIGKAFPT